ncbi:MAG: nucleotide sugar dehydrogenase [Culicoidibacterales bacterium]
MKITVVGAGYVGIANAFILGVTEEVTIIDIDVKKIENLKKGIMPIDDAYIEKYKKRVNVAYSADGKWYYEESDFIIIATNTDFDEQTKKFNTESIESIIAEIDSVVSEEKKIIIKSTIPIGYTDTMQAKYKRHKICFSPEFLRESFALYDNLYPDRIVVGGADDDLNLEIACLLNKNTKSSKKPPIILTTGKEAEVIKLFANTYLAMRIAFVNELDTYCQELEMKTQNVLDAIGYDHRIGRHYFNPSFGYGGYCLPKDSKQLEQEYSERGIESSLMPAIVESNEKRKRFIAKKIIEKTSVEDVIGIYRIIAKKGINNHRSSAILDIISQLKGEGKKIVIYEPELHVNYFMDCKVITNLIDFKQQSDIIVANRLDEYIGDADRIYSVDVYGEN